MSAAPPSPTTSTPAPTVAPGGLARWTHAALVANLAAQILIIGTGGAVRLTGSGLGCSTWPQCEPGEFTPRLHDAATIHPFIEFGNRTLTGVLTVVALAVAVLVWRERTRSRSFRVLGLVPLLGVLVQAVLGGITVLVDLHPAVVGSHMFISMGLVAVSTVLVVRWGELDGPARPLVPERVVRLGQLLAVLGVAVVALGIVTTGAGPHSGDNEVGYRFALDPYLVAKVHALSVWAFVLVLAALLVSLRTGPRRARRAAFVLLAVTLAQAVVGYVQFFTGLPIALVNLHMVAAAGLMAVGTWFLLTLRERTPAAERCVS
ncbi:COX15/CtaA family protein [Cellulomonas soli]|uniref:Protein required for cytochrome oxidase assembly n=1 Tax=Cellulomonas soli TaxID=931535 RepID=A0A512PHB7_9CELL|nr:COX15/CtaA family protein [Cellulomonas soli]NYI60894.1 cytochrome c oxidase assembly protein subunit 15 [Cellulomonas soli]GEP70522.1 protein required for cytochrome oxidase assembly [Cellulomonas soli]